jgi:hypothetical protein
MIDIARKRQRPGTGSRSVFPEEIYRLEWPDLTPILADLPWAIVGGVATRLYMPERATKDLDVVIRSEDGAEARRRLRDGGLTYNGPLSIPGTKWSATDGTPIDILEIDATWIDDALSSAARNRDRTGAPIMPLSYLVLMKVQSGRFQDTADIGRMLTAASDKDIEMVRAVVQKYEPDALDDLDSTVVLARLERESET